VQWLVTPRAASGERVRIRLVVARGRRFGVWPAAKRRFTLLDFAPTAATPAHAGRGTDVSMSPKKSSRHREYRPPRGSRFAGDENRPDGDIRLGKLPEFIARSAFRESRWNNNAASDDSDERLTPPPAARANQIGHNARAFLRRETFYCLRESATPWRISRKCCQLSGLFSIK